MSFGWNFPHRDIYSSCDSYQRRSRAHNGTNEFSFFHADDTTSDRPGVMHIARCIYDFDGFASN